MKETNNAISFSYLEEDIRKITKQIGDTPGAIRDLEDHQLLALAAWTQDGNEDIKAECVRRAESGRRFAHYLDDGDAGKIATRSGQS